MRLIRAGLASLVKCKTGSDPDRKLAWLLVIGCIPAQGLKGRDGQESHILWHRFDHFLWFRRIWQVCYDTCKLLTVTI